MKGPKDCYEILGLKEGASLEQVTARWMELKKEFQSKPREDEETLKAIREVNEAYEMLKGSVPSSVEFDMQRFLRESAASRKAKKEKKRKKIIISSSILAICLIIGAYIFISERPQGITRLASTTRDDPDRKIRRSMEETAPRPPSESQAPESIAKVVPQESSKTVIPEIAKPVPATPPPLKVAPPVEVAKKVVPPEASKKVIPEAAKPVPPAPPALKPAPPVEVAKKVVPPEPSKKVVPEAARPVPAAPPALKPAPAVEVAKGVPREPSRAVVPEPARPAPLTPSALRPAPAVEVAKEVSPEPSKTVIPEAAQPVPPAPPVLKPAPPVEVAKVIPQEPSKAATPPPPSGPPVEGEVRQFLRSYVNSYNNKSIEGFISFFSPKAIQNQKDNFEKIRKTYDTFFDRMETVQYRVTINEINPQQNSVEVRGQYALEGVLMDGRKQQNWKGQVRWVLVREGGDLKILSLDYQPQK